MCIRDRYTVYETLTNLEVKDKPIITVFNKQDLAEEGLIIRDFHADYTAKISAKKGDGLSELLQTIEAVPVSYTHLDVYKRQSQSLAFVL